MRKNKLKGDGLGFHIIEKFVDLLGEFEFKKSKTIENFFSNFAQVI